MTVTKTRAAVLREPGEDQWWEIEELDVDPPQAGEVLVRIMASGLCHSDDHLRTGMAPMRMPMVGGHEGSGVVEEVGPGVTRVKPGDHIVCSFIPACGRCRWCSTGHQNMCDAGLNAGIGCMQDKTFRLHTADGQDLGGMCVLGTFAQYAVVSEWSCVAIDPYIPFDVAALVSCGVPTGWGSAVYVGETRAGETVAVFGVGGVGINAVQGARYAGAKNVIAIDPNELKLETAKRIGATHVFTDPDEAREKIVEMTWGQLCDVVVCTVDVMTEDVVTRAVNMTGKCGRVVITGVGPRSVNQLSMPAGALIGFQRTIRGSVCGGCNPLFDIPRLLGLYQAGDLELEGLITQRYSLDQINDGYRDLLAGRNVRGVLMIDH